MKVIYGVGRLPELKGLVVAAAGVFDGVHLGHQRVVSHAVSEARTCGGTSLVITFHPHPTRVLHPEKFKGYLMSLSQRLEQLAALEVDYCLVVRFTRRFAAMSADVFVRRYLVRALKVREVVVGGDFHFGHHRRGGIRLLARLGGEYGFKVIPERILNRGMVSIKSSLVRELVGQGKLMPAAALLGRPFVLRGRVVHGDGRGRGLGYPTANLQAESAVIPPSGIYVARVLVPGSGAQMLPSMVYIGSRPTFRRLARRWVVEVHILDFNKDLYGCEIDVMFMNKIREDRRFKTKEDLIVQICNDEQTARDWFRQHP